MPSLAGALTGLGLLALPAVPSPTYFASKATSADTWSLTVSDSGSVSATTPPIAQSASDVWSITLSAESGAVATYPSQKTQLSLLALPAKYSLVTAKAVTSSQSISGSDIWNLGWQEQPTDLVIIDTWDTWALTFALEQIGVSISQTFTAGESWALSWLDVGSVFAGGPIPRDLTDTWSLTISDSASVAATVDAADTWSIQITDAGAVGVSSDTKNGSETWSLAFTNETGFFSPVVDIPILASDEWKLIWADASGVIKLSIDVPSKRRIRVDGPIRINRVD